MRYGVTRHFLLLVLGGLLLAGCASAPQQFEYLGGDALSARQLVWPAPPEAPRIKLVGELRGEDNFQLSEEQKSSTALKVLRWVVGLSSRFVRKKQLIRPQAIVSDEAGRIFVSDVGRSAIFVFDTLNGKFDIWDWARPGEQFTSPIGVAVDTDGSLLVADAGLGAVIRLDAQGNPIDEIGASQLQRPTGLALDTLNGELYVADTTAHQVKVFDQAGDLLRVIGGPGTGPGQFNRPVYLSFVRNKLYVSDTLNARVQVFKPDGELLRVIGERGLYLGNLTHPKGVAADSDGNVYVTEAFYDYLLIFDQQGQFLLPLGGRGQKPGQFFLPAGVWRDESDKIYVADMFNQRVIVLQYLGDKTYE